MLRSCKRVEMHQQGPTKQFDADQMLHHSQWYQLPFDRLLAHHSFVTLSYVATFCKCSPRD